MASEERVVSAADPAALERYIMDVCQPKNEQEWWAAHEIERLRARIADLTDQLGTLSGEVQGLEYVIGEVYAKQIADCECGGGDCEACRIMAEDVRTGRERWESLTAQLAAEKERAGDYRKMLDEERAAAVARIHALEAAAIGDYGQPVVIVHGRLEELAKDCRECEHCAAWHDEANRLTAQLASTSPRMADEQITRVVDEVMKVCHDALCRNLTAAELRPLLTAAIRRVVEGTRP